MLSFYRLRSSVLSSCLCLSVCLTIPLLYTILKPPCCPEKAPLALCSFPVTPVSAKVSLPNPQSDGSWEDRDLWTEDVKWAGWLEEGGVYSPSHCQPTTRVLILIPYRNRSSQLAHFLSVMHPFLQRQEIHYTIAIVNQTDDKPFLRGLLFNAGFLEAMSHFSPAPDCIVLHDVDHLPERMGMYYTCSVHGVTHLSHAIDRFDYNLFMSEFTGGVSAMTRRQYEAVNGFSNMYIGWGCEDEDLYIRIKAQQLILIRVPVELARYTTMPHVPNYPNWFWDQQISRLDRERFPNLREIVDKDGGNTDRFEYNKYLQECAHERITLEGLNNARDYYHLEKVVQHNGFTEFQVTSNIQLIHKHGMEYIAQSEHFAEMEKQLK